MPGRETKNEASHLGVAKDINKKLQAVENQFIHRINEVRVVAEVPPVLPLSPMSHREESSDKVLPFSGVLNSLEQNPIDSEPTDSN